MTPLLNKTPLQLRLLFAALVVFIVASCTPEQRAVIEQINNERDAAGESMLVPHPELIAQAQLWADTMAAENYLRHSDLLGEGIPGGWGVIGENVGIGEDLSAIQAAFLDSPAHRANMIDPRFDTMGTGVAVAPDGSVWVVQLFAQYSPGSDAEEVAGAGVAAGVTQLRHGAGLDLADALTGEVEVLADLFESARFTTVETEAKLQDLALTLIEWAEQTGDLVGQQRRSGDLER